MPLPGLDCKVIIDKIHASTSVEDAARQLRAPCTQPYAQAERYPKNKPNRSQVRNQHLRREITASDDAVRIVYYLSAAANSASNPHASVEMEIPCVSGLHVNVEPEGITFGIDLVGLGRIIKLFQYVSGPDTPAFSSDSDKCGRMVVGLEKIVRLDMG
jgi:hypothetical protein